MKKITSQYSFQTIVKRYNNPCQGVTDAHYGFLWVKFRPDRKLDLLSRLNRLGWRSVTWPDLPSADRFHLDSADEESLLGDISNPDNVEKCCTRAALTSGHCSLHVESRIFIRFGSSGAAIQQEDRTEKEADFCHGIL
jgi:hypothetical protein